MAKPDVWDLPMIDVLTDDLRGLFSQHYVLAALAQSGCTREDNFAGQGVIPMCDMQRHSVFKSSPELGTYNHHQCIVKWKDEYWCGWDNGFIDEDAPGQRTFLSRSKDGASWSERILLTDGDADGGMLRVLGGLYPRGDKMYAFIQEMWNVVKADEPGMTILDARKTSFRNDLWVTSNGTDWELVRKSMLDVHITFEKPRLTEEGRLLLPTTLHTTWGPGMILWPGDDPEETPQIIEIPHSGTHGEGTFPYAQASWYTDDDGRIWSWWRDESATGYLWVALSEDGGQSWSQARRSNFPNSMSRVFAGRLSDGRFYLMGNATRLLLERNFFALALSDDGAKFNKVFQLVSTPTRQRFGGQLKCHGFQYPSCLVDGDKLLATYSVNKEDIEVGIIDTTAI